MQYGVSTPQGPTGMDPVAVRDFAQAAEELGYEFINNSDSVLSDGPDIRHEPLVLQGYPAAVTQRMTLGTSIVIMPQRQTALVAKQLAEVDLLSGAACAWASAWVPARRSTPAWAPTSTRAGGGWRSRSR